MSIIDRAGEKLKRKQDAQESHAEPDYTQQSIEHKKDATRTPAPMLQQIGELILEGENTLKSSKKEIDNKNKLSIDLDQIQRQGFYPSEDALEQLTNAFRRVKRPLLANMVGRGKEKVEKGNFVMISSALPGEGKTFSAFNLAISFAQEKDWQVILIDCDNIRQTITTFLGLRGTKGFFDALSSDDMSVNDALIETNINNLFVMPSGTQYENAAEMLSSKRMEAVLNQLTSKHPNRIILFDTPPLLGISESTLISEHVGQVLFVVKAGSTNRQIVAEALQVLGGAKEIGFLLNQTAKNQDEGYKNLSHYYKTGRVQ